MEYKYDTSFQEITEALKDASQKCSYLRQLLMDKKPSFLCHHLQFVRFDALDEKDYPHGIALNSVFLTFEINHQDKRIELHSYGHVSLNEEDKKTEKYRYYCMKSVIDVIKDNGGKKFRKQKFKDAQDAAKKMVDYFQMVMNEVDKYTGGYPYK